MTGPTRAFHRQALGGNTHLNPGGDSETALIAHPDVPTRALSAGRLHLPGGSATTPQQHEKSEVVLATISGYAAVLSGPGLNPLFPRPGDMVYTPPGVRYCVVNLSRNASLLLLTVHTDPGFTDDRQHLPELDERALEFIEQLRAEHLDRVLGRRAGRHRRTR